MYNRASFHDRVRAILSWFKLRGAVLFKRSVSRGVYPRNRGVYTSSIPSPFSSSQSVGKIKVGDYILEPITSGLIQHPESAGDGI